MGNPSPANPAHAQDAPSSGASSSTGSGGTGTVPLRKRAVAGRYASPLGSAQSLASSSGGSGTVATASGRGLVRDTVQYSLLALVLLAVVMVGPELFGHSGRGDGPVERRAPAPVTTTAAAEATVPLPVSVPTHCTATNLKVLSMTFDDGPGLKLGDYLAAFKTAQAKVAFHFVPSVVTSFNDGPGLAAQAVADGHIVGLRFDPNTNALKLDNATLVQSLVSQSEALQKVTGRYPKFVRYNWGQVDDRVVAVTQAMNMVVTGFNLDVQDYAYESSGGYPGGMITTKYVEAFSAVANNPQQSLIAVHHDLNSAASVLIPDLVATIRGYGYTILPFDACVGVQEAYRASNAAPVGYSATTPAGSNGGAAQGTLSGASATETANVVKKPNAAAAGPAAGAAWGVAVGVMVAAALAAL
ncbi:Carbohydrate esterase 4 protein [Allomyces javanicus]|nr:Carbohydrate esterase 4 protein [Allomyces javanicus]